MSAYEELMAYQRETEALSQISGRLGWDQETVMPRGAAPQRAEEMAALQTVLHNRRTDARIGEWLEEADASAPAAHAQLRLIRQSFERNTKVPARLAAELARKTSLSQGIWAEARKNEDFAAFAPVLKEIIDLRREEAMALADGGDLYDALLGDYEPNTTGANIDALFAELRSGLVDLRARILGSGKTAPDINHSFDEDAQMALSSDLAAAFGYDSNHGRIDRAVHPFSSGSGLDVRITTRTETHNPFNCFYSTIHEVGHATYEQNIDPAYLLTPVGRGASMGVHESQSRIYENQLGRSRAFTGYLFDRMKSAFGDFGIADADSFYAAVNQVRPGYIRTEADEIHYNLHIMMRFDIERAIIAGEVEVDSLVDAWNARFEADFGVVVDKPSNGVLQDVHWSVGLFGYFPTYSLGNIYAVCLNEALRKDLPDLDAQLAKGDTSAATGWLRERLQQHGGLRTPVETIEHATGQPVSVTPLLRYLGEKFGTLYDL